jgi:hypothetical protein
MPAPFSPVHVPFISGVRQDLSSIAQDSPSQLQTARNCVYTKKGRVTGRPGLQTRDGQVQTVGAGGSLLANLNAAISGATPSGIVSTGYPVDGQTAGDTPLACWQGQAFYQRGTQWTFAGPAWSLRQNKSAVVRTYDPSGAARTNPVPIGPTLVGTTSPGGGTSGFPILNTSGEVTSMSLAVATHFTSDSNHCMGGDVVFYIDANTGSVYGQFPNGASPAFTEVLLATTAASTSTTPQQITSAVLANDGFYYLAFKSSVAGRIDVLRINSSGTVTQTLSLTGLGSVANIGITHNGSGRLGLAWNNFSTALMTKVITITGGVMADSGLNVTLTGVPLNILGLDVGTLAVGTTHNGIMSVMFTINTGNLYIGGRSFTAATESSNTQLVSNGLGAEKEWDPLFGAVVVAGRTLVGVVNCIDVFNQSSQWLVLDVTSLYQSGNTTDRTVAAAGPYLGLARMMPSSWTSTANSVSFAIAEGLVFSPSTRAVPIIQRAGIRRITLTAQATQATHVNGLTLLSGQLMHVFDGVTVRPDHFPEEAPFIFSTTAAAAGGSLPAGSFTYQATWEMVNTRGQTVRSGASNQKTVAVTLNQKVNVVIARPQLMNSASQLEFVRVRLWATQVNPTNNAPLYFVGESVITSPSVGTPVTITHSTQATGGEEQLYETVTTLADMRAPGADRGVAYINERAWVAEQNRLYVSKLLKPNVAPAWNTEDTNVIALPASLGTIQGLAGQFQALVVVCSRGVAVVQGAGVDDTGSGAGWTLTVLDGAPGAGEISPRAVATTPNGVAYQAQDGNIWLMLPNTQVINVSRPVRDLATSLSDRAVDAVYVPPTSSTNPMFVANGAGGELRVLDLEAGQWFTWLVTSVTPIGGRYLAAVNGAVWMQLDSAPYVASLDAAVGNDLISNPITATLKTGVIRPANPTAHGWGRVRSVVLNELRLSTDTQVQVNILVTADGNQRTLLSNSGTTAPNDRSLFPNGPDNALEFRTTSQRCAYCDVQLDIVPAVFSIEGLDIWAMNTGEPTPTNNRS